MTWIQVNPILHGGEVDKVSLVQEICFDVFYWIHIIFAKVSPSSSSIGLTGYKLTLFLQKQEQQQVLLDFENGVIVKIYKS